MNTPYEKLDGHVQILIDRKKYLIKRKMNEHIFSILRDGWDDSQFKYCVQKYFHACQSWRFEWDT